MRSLRQWVVPAVVMAVVVLAAYIAPAANQGLDAATETPQARSGAWGLEEVNTAFRRALAGYAIARGLNGVISVAQGTEVAVQPAGVGLNFTPGEILDPVNDLVERFSWIMMLASSSLGIQHVLLSMSGWWGLVLALAVSGIVWAGLGLWRDRQGRYGRRGTRAGALPAGEATRIAARVFLFLAVLRFMVPAIAVVNEQVYQTFLAADYTTASTRLQQASDAIGSINEQLADTDVIDEDASLMERARNLLDRTIARVSIDRRIEEYRVAAEAISENTIRLIVVFMMQTVVFPLLFLFIAWGLLKRVARL